jgi:hypothetical protein
VLDDRAAQTVRRLSTALLKSRRPHHAAGERPTSGSVLRCSPWREWACGN